MYREPLGVPIINYSSRQANGLRFWNVPRALPPYNVVNSEELSYGSLMIAPTVFEDFGPHWYYEGNDNYDIYTNDNATWLNGWTEISIAVWTRTAISTVGNGMLVAKHVTTANGTFYLSHIGATTMRFVVINTSNTRVDHDITYSFALGTVYHIVGTYDGAAIRLYVNGVLQGTSSAQTGGLKTYATPLRLGNYGGAGFNLLGRLGETRIYNRVLTAEDVAELYDPPTRWELYYQEPDTIYAPPSTLPVKPWYAYAQQ